MSSEALCKEESEILTLQGPTMSKLLGGAKLREIRLTPSGNNESLVCTGDDSGILEISPDVPYTDDTTSVDDGSNRKVKRTARKCKWCDNFSRGSTNLCARHGGGRRCHCGKLARGPSNLCMKHGGGRRCSIANCMSASVYKSDFCRSHGGGKRCTVEGCVASVYSMKEELCFKHGGGTRCGFTGCHKAPVGTTEYCIRHGGGRRCSVDGCGKGAVCEGMCVKHHQDAYKVEFKSEPGTGASSISVTPKSPLRVVTLAAMTIIEAVKAEDLDIQ